MNNFYWCSNIQATHLLCLPLDLLTLIDSIRTLEPCSSSTTSRKVEVLLDIPVLSWLLFGSLRALAVCPYSWILHDVFFFFYFFFLYFLILYVSPAFWEHPYDWYQHNDPRSSGSCNYVPFHMHWEMHTPVTVQLNHLSNLWRTYFTRILEDNMR